MAIPDDEEQARTEKEDGDSLSSDSSDSENGLSGDEEPPPEIQWLATSREKRSTAGNRMKSMVAAEEPDDELELLFAEDADDVGFTDVEDDGSDAQMSSSEDEDAQENADELEGEKELDKQARESRQAARKRKAQEAIPVKFRKKVRIDTSRTPSASATPAPKPRPKKKSERISWLPSPADLPTRASRRETTMAGKEQLHKQMAEREIKRLKQIEAMERKAKKMEALKKPPMTQAERLAEAALVEKRNAKSLNRWEEAEKQREEERKAKLAALNNRTLEGPVVTLWSGVGEWVGGKLKHVGKIVTIEEKPAKKKRRSTIGPETAAESLHGNDISQADVPNIPDKASAVSPGLLPSDESSQKLEQGKSPAASNDEVLTNTSTHMPSTGVSQEAQIVHNHNNVAEMAPAKPPIPPIASHSQDGRASSTINPCDQDANLLKTAPQSQILPLADAKPPDLKPPDLQVPNAGIYTTSVFAPPLQSSLMMPPGLEPPSNSFLAHPAGVSQNGLSMPMIGYQPPPSSANSSNVLAPPSPAQRQSPLSMPQASIHTPPITTPIRPTPVAATPKPKTTPTPLINTTIPSTRPPPKTPLSIPKSTKGNSQRHHAKEVMPPPLPSSPANGRATRNCIILQNFNENAIKEKSVQTRILFNREMNKLPKQGPAVRCVITNHPARYRDPKTGLPYYNAYAFKQIRQLHSGEYKWSSLIGAWVGDGTSAAKGVPARFIDPNAPGPPKEQPPPKLLTDEDKIPKVANIDTVPQTANEQLMQAPITTVPTPSSIATPITPTQPNDQTLAATDRPSAEPGVEPSEPKAPVARSEPGGNMQPQVPTTEATFALNATNATPLNTPIANNVAHKVRDVIGNGQQIVVMDTSSNVPGLPAATASDLPIASSASPIVVEQGTVNQ
ncbi:putative yl1 nuclear protein [Rosellinia necatrix]|uniref:Putative yl1 nuclear protein n=1 Tax=Rosellinia necatrix TaxID=77044 RepID=A0A1W2TJX3_ROSNE|nr:putative yl1 nuclear protein [Rosellinia necatrix]